MRSQRKFQRGVAALELAIATPLLLILMLGVAEMGRAFYQYNALTKSVRDAARYLSEHALNGAEVIDLVDEIPRTRNLLIYGNTQGTGESILPLDGDAPPVVTITEDGVYITVSVSYQYQPIFAGGLPTFGLGSDIDTLMTFRSSSVMRALL